MSHTSDLHVPEGFALHEVFGCFPFFSGELPEDLRDSARHAFGTIWGLHPEEFPEGVIHGRRIQFPRWQQSFGHSYRYSGAINKALPTPSGLQVFLDWARNQIDPRFNGLLLNWYDGSEGHCIGQHRDSTKDVVVGSPIVTISLGAERVFRLSKKGERSVDFPSLHGSVFVIPWKTNSEVKHGVPHRPSRDSGLRISITMRAFEPLVG